MGLRRVYEKWVTTDQLRKIKVPRERVFTKRELEEEESLKNSIKSDPESFFETSPIIVSGSIESEKLYLADGFDRIKIVIKENIPKAKLRIREFDTDWDAYDDARMMSYKINKIRGGVVGISVINLAKTLREEGKSIKEIAKRFDTSEKYIRYLLDIAKDQEIMEKLEKEEISIHKAIEMLQEKKYIKRETVSQQRYEEEKTISEPISAEEAKIELRKVSEERKEEISEKEAKIEEIKKEQGAIYKPDLYVQELYAHVPKWIQEELEDAFKSLEKIIPEVSSIEVKKKIVEAAVKALKDLNSEIQKEAIRIWARECKKSKRLDYDFSDYIWRAEEKIEEKKAKREEKKYEAPKPRVEKVEAMPELKVEKEAPTTKEVEAPKKPLDEVEICIQYFKDFLTNYIQKFPHMRSLLEPKAEENIEKIARDWRLKDIYEKVGYAGTVLLTSMLTPSMIEKKLFGLDRELIRKGVIIPTPYGGWGELFINNLVRYFREEAEGKIMKSLEKASEEKARIASDIVKSYGRMIGELYLAECGDYDLLVIKKKRDKEFFMTDAPNIKLTELLASTREGLEVRKRDVKLISIDEFKVSKELQGTKQTIFFMGLTCLGCGEPLRCYVCGSIVNCVCGWPNTEKEFRLSSASEAHEQGDYIREVSR